MTLNGIRSSLHSLPLALPSLPLSLSLFLSLSPSPVFQSISTPAPSQLLSFLSRACDRRERRAGHFGASGEEGRFIWRYIVIVSRHLANYRFQPCHLDVREAHRDRSSFRVSHRSGLVNELRLSELHERKEGGRLSR